MQRGKQADILQTLVFYDTPQVMLLAIREDRYAVSVAIDSDNGELMHLAAEIDEKQLSRYLTQEHDLLYLFRFPKWKNWYVFNLMDASDDAVRLYPADEDLYSDDDNLPDPGFFAREHTDEYGAIAKTAVDKKKFEIDGAWNLSDFSRFYGRLSDLYAFFLSFNEYQSPSIATTKKRQILEAFLDPPLQGGSSYVNLYRDLRKLHSGSERLRVHSIAYASPGHVTIEGSSDVFSKIDNNRRILSSKYKSVKYIYDELRQYLKKNKLLRHEKDRFDSSSAIAEYIYAKACTLAKELGIDDCDTLYQMAGQNKLAFAKVVLAHFRRSRDYFFFFAEGRVGDE